MLPHSHRTRIARFMRHCMYEHDTDERTGGVLLAVNIFDRYMDYLRKKNNPLFRANPGAMLRAVIGACLLIASKYHHTDAFKVRELACVVSLGPLSSKSAIAMENAIRRAEQSVLSCIGFGVGTPLADTVLCARFGPLKDVVGSHTFSMSDLVYPRTLIEIFSSGDAYLDHSPDELAAAAVYLAKMTDPTTTTNPVGDMSELAARIWAAWLDEPVGDRELGLAVPLADPVQFNVPCTRTTSVVGC